jgi:DNA-directed RNA polymerase specialized sigma24 family protein
MEELVKYMRALTFLQLQALTGADTFGKPELLLSKAGFTQKEIAGLLEKKESAVSMAISRARASATRVTR